MHHAFLFLDLNTAALHCPRFPLVYTRCVPSAQVSLYLSILWPWNWLIGNKCCTSSLEERGSWCWIFSVRCSSIPITTTRNGGRSLRVTNGLEIVALNVIVGSRMRRFYFARCRALWQGWSCCQLTKPIDQVIPTHLRVVHCVFGTIEVNSPSSLLICTYLPLRRTRWTSVPFPRAFVNNLYRMINVKVLQYLWVDVIPLLSSVGRTFHASKFIKPVIIPNGVIKVHLYLSYIVI